MPSIEDEFRAKLLPSQLKGAGAYEPKLTFEERCQILALDKVGSKRTQSASAYHISRATVAYICNTASRHYRNVRKEYADLGKEAFIRKYLTDEVIAKYRAHEATVEATATDAEYRAERQDQTKAAGLVNPRATVKAGVHNFENARGTIVISVIEFCETSPEWDTNNEFTDPGWYVKVMMNNKSEMWGETSPYHPTIVSFPTSQEAYKSVMEGMQLVLLP